MIWVRVICLKSSQNRKDLNNFTASPFSVAFLVAGNWEKDTKNGAAVKSLKSFLFCNDFNMGDTYMRKIGKKNGRLFATHSFNISRLKKEEATTK